MSIAMRPCRDCRAPMRRDEYIVEDDPLAPLQFAICRSCRARREAATGRAIRPRRTAAGATRKRCSNCSEVKDVSEFSPVGTFVTGEIKYGSKCKACNASIKRAKHVPAPYDWTAWRPKETKVCRVCGAELPLSEFPKSRISKHGQQLHHGTCKSCGTGKAKGWRGTQDPARLKAQRRVWLFSLDQEQYGQILRSQGGACAICAMSFAADGRDVYIDHDHLCCPGRRSCGKCIRGFLCNRCNTALGQLRDSKAILEAALRYVESTVRPLAATSGAWYREQDRWLISHMMSGDEYATMRDQQDGCCAICQEKSSSLEIDHDHSCHPGLRSCRQCIRGLLCPRCNKGLGLLQDSSDRLRGALAYLDRRPLSDGGVVK
ncbi:endonuclease domain-containing protein [Brachybacterium sp. NPDC056505]|uniref:endonuclease domain-containing protein n=1 Tax=Brachybacterium sp. NPDC056505 TaxID=3345843 RepID=UPI00367336A1